MYTAFETLLGKTLVKIARDGDERLTFHTSEEEFAMFHEQDCCENVFISEIIGDLDDLIGTPILLAEVVGSDEPSPNEYSESHTWTFYKLATVKGHVTIRWLGESNGYYSEGVDFVRISPTPTEGAA